MRATANAIWRIAWVDPIVPSLMFGPYQFTVRSFSPSPMKGSLSFIGMIHSRGIEPGRDTVEILPTIPTTFALWRSSKASGGLAPERKRFTSSRAIIHRKEPMGDQIVLTLDFPDYGTANENPGEDVGSWLREQIQQAAHAAALVRESQKPIKPIETTVVLPKMKRGGARGMFDAMSAPTVKVPDDEKKPMVVPEGARHFSMISHTTPPPSPAPSGSIWIDRGMVRVSVGGGYWIEQGHMVVAHAAKMGKS